MYETSFIVHCLQLGVALVFTIGGFSNMLVSLIIQLGLSLFGIGVYFILMTENAKTTEKFTTGISYLGVVFWILYIIMSSIQWSQTIVKSKKALRVGMDGICAALCSIVSIVTSVSCQLELINDDKKQSNWELLLLICGCLYGAVCVVAFAFEYF